MQSRVRPDLILLYQLLHIASQGEGEGMSGPIFEAQGIMEHLLFLVVILLEGGGHRVEAVLLVIQGYALLCEPKIKSRHYKSSFISLFNYV